MPDYTYPGVYVEETGPGPHPIEGVSTTVVAFLGFAESGPLTPTQITSFAEYSTAFGGFIAGSYIAYAVQGFFSNGGQQCYVSRVPSDCSSSEDLLAPLDALDDVSIVCCADEHSMAGMTAAIIAHCERLRYRIAVLASPPNSDFAVLPPDEARSSFAAYYAPWVLAANPDGGAPIPVHPGGHIAGAIVRSDLQHGAWKAPANLPILEIVGLEREITAAQQEALNDRGVNAMRHFPGRGYLIWGARTTSTDPEWKYINVRRYLIYLEKSIDEGTQWVVFENNGETLWGNVQKAVSDFLFNEWKSGALQGTKPEDAYFVRCDRTTMTQDDIDNGRLVCLVGVATLYPAEFIIFRISQFTADASCS
jgi:hypothetical protein